MKILKNHEKLPSMQIKTHTTIFSHLLSTLTYISLVSFMWDIGK